MQRYERLNTLIEILAARGRIEVDATADELGVSAATIRRDLDHLAEQQLLTRTHGGAVAQSVSYDLPLQYKAARHTAQKRRVAEVAAQSVTANMVIGLNGGTTMTEIARILATRSDLAAAGPAPSLTIVTNALNIAHEVAFRPQFKLVMTGGVARPRSYELIGPLAASVLSQLRLDLAFVGVDAISAQDGASAHHEGEAEINRLLVDRAEKVVMATDGSKVGGRAFARICPITDVDVLITDDTAPRDAALACEEAGTEVVYA